MRIMYVNRQRKLSLPTSRLNSDVERILPGPSANKYTKERVSSTSQRQLISLIPSAQRNRWHCGICGKSLSSKRSYDEHMNIHNDARPFACDHCDYAAASQMTLRRHKLRSHTARREWGYKCPYCYESYMEPASYQQHVQSRHFGRSATFGCPYTECKFQSKCFRHFREHLAKHNCYDCYIGQPDRTPFSFPDDELDRFLVDDEYGYGYHLSEPTCKVQLIKKRACPAVTVSSASMLPINVVNFHDSPPHLCAEVRDEDFMKEPLKITSLTSGVDHRCFVNDKRFGELPRLQEESQEVYQPDTDWIEGEVEVPLSEIPLLPDGQMDIELD